MRKILSLALLTCALAADAGAAPRWSKERAWEVALPKSITGASERPR